MALDLSTVSEPTYEEAESSSRYVLLASETLTISGSNEILFEVAQSGQLFLAQFFVENINGTCVLRRRSLPLTEHGSEVDDVGSGEATNLCISKSLSENNYASHLVNGYSASQSEEATLPTAMTSSRTDEGSLSTTISAPTTQHGGVQNTTTSYTASDSLRISANLLSGIVSKLLEQQKHRQPAGVAAHAAAPVGSDDDKNDVVLFGHNLSELSRFVDRLRDYRQLVGLSQCQLSSELARHFRNESLFSQPLLSRFEKLNVSVRAAFRLLPYLKTWLSHAEKQKCASPEGDCLGMASLPLGTTACQAPGTAHTTSLDPRPIRSVGRARLSVLAARMVHSSAMATGQSLAGSEPQQETNRGNTVSPDPKAGLSHPPGTPVCKTTLPTDSAHMQMLRPVETSGPTEHQSVPRSGGDPFPEALSTSTSTAPSCQLTLAEHSRPWRRKRTRFDPATLATLAIAFTRSPHPSGVQLSRLATETGHTRESIRIWFGNRRQLTNQTKPIKKQNTAS